MDQTLDILLSTLPIIVFCVVVWALVVMQRRIFEGWLFVAFRLKYKVDVAKNLFYNEVLLPCAPIGTSVLLAVLVPSYPLFVVMPGVVGRIFVGIFLGLFCGLVYRMVKKYLLTKIGAVKDDTTFDFSPIEENVLPAPTVPTTQTVPTTPSATITATTTVTTNLQPESGVVPNDPLPSNDTEVK